MSQRVLHVSAGGRGSRMSSNVDVGVLRPPKHLLPLPVRGGTILGEILRVAREDFDLVTIWSGVANHKDLSIAFLGQSNVLVQVDQEMSGPLGPMIRNLLHSGARVYGCAGDFYSVFRWVDFESFHNGHNRPISILTSSSVPVKEGARFEMSGPEVVSWERVSVTNESDKINVGCYIIDYTPEVEALLKALKSGKEDEFFDTFIPAGLVAAYDPGTTGFNVNSPEVYESLLRALK